MKKILSVYFNAPYESNEIPSQGNISLATLLDHMTLTNMKDTFSICVNGYIMDSDDLLDACGLFAFHLGNQVNTIANRVKTLLESKEDSLVLNIYGFSRGGVAALLLCQKLKQIPSERLTINVASFEPVPGNYITTANYDIWLDSKLTLSSEIADLTQCQNLVKALVLFTNQKLPEITYHGAILPTFPNTCQAEIDVTAGNHANAVNFYKKGQSVKPMNYESAAVFNRITDFLQQCGTQFDFNRLELDHALVYSQESKSSQSNTKLLALYQHLTARTAVLDGATIRSMHLSNSIFTANTPKKYLNRYHQKLLQGESKGEDYLLSLSKYQPSPIQKAPGYLLKFMQLAAFIAFIWILYNKFAPFTKVSEEICPLPPRF